MEGTSPGNGLLPMLQASYSLPATPYQGHIPVSRLRPPAAAALPSEELAMAIHFPNVSRSYDADHHRIRFWGHDDAVEIPFFLDENVIFKLAPRTANGETAILAAFDAARERIFAAATRIYSPRQGRSFYVLAPADF
jgi:hypothetical protein